MTGLKTLFMKEMRRFLKVATQTLIAPLVSTLLYLLVFSQVLKGRGEVYAGVSYGTFLIPGLVMMAMLQNAFANSSSSLVQSRITGNLVFLLLSPLSAGEIYWGYVLAAMVRGLLVGGVVYMTALFFFEMSITAVVWVFLFAVLGTLLTGTLGILAGLWSEKFDQMAAWQNFVIVPLTFLSGAFYSLKGLAPMWQNLSHLNPFFYVTDGFRYGFFGQSDVSPVLSLLIVLLCCAVLMGVTGWLLHRGWRIRN